MNVWTPSAGMPPWLSLRWILSLGVCRRRCRLPGSLEPSQSRGDQGPARTSGSGVDWPPLFGVAMAQVPLPKGERCRVG